MCQKISIIPRSGGALGFAYIPPAPEGEERQLLFVDELRGQLVTLLGGRAAEEVAFNGRVSTGAMDDIRRATDLAYKGLAEYGLSSATGPLSISTLSGAGGDGFFGFPDQVRAMLVALGAHFVLGLTDQVRTMVVVPRLNFVLCTLMLSGAGDDGFFGFPDQVRTMVVVHCAHFELGPLKPKKPSPMLWKRLAASALLRCEGREKDVLPAEGDTGVDFPKLHAYLFF